MEFYNVKLLPKELPEIIAQFVPCEIYSDTKVIAYPRKWRGPAVLHGTALGYAGYDNLTDSFHIGLYPTMCCSNGGHGGNYPGTLSFQLWMAMLRTALHEIGHLATSELYDGIPHDDEQHLKAHLYVETLVNEWADRAMARILRVDPRLGQPPGALTGYPGILAYQFLTNQGRPWGDNNCYRIAEWRGLRCGGQVTINDIAEKFVLEGVRLRECPHPGVEGWTREKARYRRAIHRAAEALGICRYFTNKNGRRYLMFNAAEAEAVYEWLVDNRKVLLDAYFMVKHQEGVPKHRKWELVDGNWDLIGIDAPIKAPPEQMRLPL